MKMFLVFMLALILSACATSGGVAKPAHLSIHQRFEIACVSAGTAYGVITTVNNIKPLSAAQQAQVRGAKVKIDRRCKLAPGQDYPYTASLAIMGELEGASATLTRIEGEVK